MAPEGPIVKTPLGELQGLVLKTDRDESIYSFLGIPYAKPPVGALRFKDPIPIEAWSGLRQAVKSPPMATAAVPTENGTVLTSGSEDCLYVSVHTPEVPNAAKKLPVMVWIHGGGFTNGTGNFEWYGPDYLVPKGVILVAINYRLGAFGFLSFQNKECVGNFGLKDQALALKWVQQNIASFGGDPKNVTIFGESAGAASVQYHLLSPLSKGLFQRAIAQSGSALNRWAFSRHPVESAFLLAKNLGYDGKDEAQALETIRKATTEEILKKSVGIQSAIEGRWAGEHILEISFAPTIEPEGTPNAFLAKSPVQAIIEGDVADVPYITGVCSHEMVFGLPKPDFVPDWNDDIEFQKVLPKEMGHALGTEKMATASKKLKEYYFPNGSNQEGYILAMSYGSFVRGVLKTVKAHSKNPKKTAPDYLYVLKSSPPNSAVKRLLHLENVKGVSHGEDLEYLFRAREGMLQNPPIAAGTNDDVVKENITKLWTDFAKTGKVDPVWPVADDKKGLPYVEIAEKITPKDSFYPEEDKVWDEIYAILNA